MNRLSFNLPDGMVVAEAVLVANVIDGDGKEFFRMMSHGEPRATSQIGMLEAGLRRTQKVLDETWEER